VRPLAEAAWVAESSAEVDRRAVEVVRLLGLRDIPRPLRLAQAVLGELAGERDGEDAVERESPGEVHPGLEGEEVRTPGLPPLPDAHPAGVGAHALAPAPYRELWEEVAPLATELIEELRLEERAELPTPQERGGRLSIRQALRTPETPFLAPEEERPERPTLTFRLVVDYSTSMNWSQRMRYAREGAMLLHRVALELGIPHQIVTAPHNLPLADLESGERGRAMIAGLVGKTAWEDIGLAIQTNAPELARREERIKLLLCIHDGLPNDGELAKEECARWRGQVEVIGLGLDLNEECEMAMREIFGADRLILCRAPAELPKKLGALLRAVYGR